MTDQKPTGVFVRLQDGELNEQQRADFIADMDCGEVVEKAILAIGTPMQDGELDEVGFEVVHAHGSNLTYCRDHAQKIASGADGIIYSLVRQSEAKPR